MKKLATLMKMRKYNNQTPKGNDNHHKSRLNSELRQQNFQKMLSLRTADSLPHGTLKILLQI